ncbi:MAG TPA: hypothetical protein VF658_17250 [Pyrinomonadaceae bacterium]|jgi:hypothetical protein
MKKQASIIFIIFLWLSIIGAQALPLTHSKGSARRVVYKTYTNARYGYSIAYPSSLLIPQGEADNGDGQAFRSKDGAAEMRVYGSQNMGGGLTAAYTEAQAGKDVSYKIIKRNWFVVSGRSGGKVFYQKTMMKNDVLKTFTIEYDEAQKATYDAVTTRIARSFKG